MRDHSEIYAAHQRARFMRPDAARWMRPDAARWIRPDIARFLRPGTDPADVYTALDHKFNPSQLRIPAGRTGGGRWTDDSDAGDVQAPGSAGDSEFGQGLAHTEERPTLLIDTTNWGINDVPAADDGADELEPTPVAWRGPNITDALGEPYYNPGGHHELPGEILREWDLPEEIRRMFNSATTGRLNGTIRTDPDGVPIGNFWNGPNGAHANYNRAVRELADRFLSENDIAPSEMTTEQALELLRQIRESTDPRIRDFNRMLRLLRRLRIFRMGPRPE